MWWRLPLSCLGSWHWLDRQNTNLSQVTAFIKAWSRCIIWLHCWTLRDSLIQTNESKTIIFKGSVKGGGLLTHNFYGEDSTHRNAHYMLFLNFRMALNCCSSSVVVHKILKTSMSHEFDWVTLFIHMINTVIFVYFESVPHTHTSCYRKYSL